MSTFTPPRERTRRGTGSGTTDAWRVIVLNDDHNTFEGVARALAQTIPGVDYDRGMALANRIHSSGQALVWSGTPGAGRALPLATRGVWADPGAA